MRIRKRFSVSDHPSLPTSYLSLSNFVTWRQPREAENKNEAEEGQDLHPSEALLQRIRDLLWQFRRRCSREYRFDLNRQPDMETSGEEEEREHKKMDCMQINPMQMDDSQREKEKEKAEKKPMSIENGKSDIMRDVKSFNVDPSPHQVGRWLEEEKAFPFKKRKRSLAPSQRTTEALIDKKMRMKIKIKSQKAIMDKDSNSVDNEGVVPSFPSQLLSVGKITNTVKCDVMDKDPDSAADDDYYAPGAYGNVFVQTQRSSIDNDEERGGVLMEGMKMSKKVHEEELRQKMKNRFVKDRVIRSSIVIEGMQMTTRPSERRENIVEKKPAIPKRRGRKPLLVLKLMQKPNPEEGDGEEKQVGVNRGVVRRRGRRSGAIIIREGKNPIKESSDEEEEEKRIGVTRSPVSANSGAVIQGSRCSRYNGRGWRCRQLTLVGYALCEHHLGKARMKSMSSVGRRSSSINNGKKQQVGPPARKKGKEVVLDDDDDEDEEWVMMSMRKRKRERGEASTSKQPPYNY